MEVLVIFLFACLCLNFILPGGAIECYFCHQTSKECKNGVRERLKKINCPQDMCFVLKYETEKPGVTVQAVHRGCYNVEHSTLLHDISNSEHLTRQKEFNLCNTTLCNNAWKMSSSYLYVLVALYSVYIL